MIAENLDKTISVLVAVGSAGFGWWAHLRQIEKERKRIIHEERERYAAIKVEQNNADRDLKHVRKNQQQLSSNLEYLSRTNDRRMDEVEKQLQQLLGAVNVLKSAVLVKK